MVLGINLFSSGVVDVWENRQVRQAEIFILFFSAQSQCKASCKSNKRLQTPGRESLLERKEQMGKGTKKNLTGEFGTIFSTRRQQIIDIIVIIRIDRKKMREDQTDQPVYRAAMLQVIPCYRNICIFYLFELSLRLDEGPGA